MDLLGPIESSTVVGELCAHLVAGRRVVATGAHGSSTNLLAGAVAARAGRPVVLVVAHLDDADECEAELSGLGRDVLRLPALEVLPGETGVALDLFAQRLAVVRRLANLTGTPVLVSPIQALMQGVPRPDAIGRLVRSLATGDRADPAHLAAWLTDAGYKRLDAVEEPGDFAMRGGILDVFPAGGSVVASGKAEGVQAPVRLDFFADEIESIREIDLETMGSDRALDSVEIVTNAPDHARPGDDSVSVLDLMPPGSLALIAETLEVTEQGRGYYERATDTKGIFGPPSVFKKLGEKCVGLAEINQFSAGAAAADVRLDLPVEPIPSFDRDASVAIAELAELPGRVVVPCQNEGERSRFGELLAERGNGTESDNEPRARARGTDEDGAPRARARGSSEKAGAVESFTGYIHRGFTWRGDAPFTVVPYHELLHRFEVRRGAGRLKTGRAMDTFLDVQPGDYVVHAEHGIAMFVGLTLMKPKGEKGKAETEEYLTLEFAGKSRLHVPCAQIDLVQKYVGGFGGKPPLSHVGGTKWKNAKARVAESVRDLAGEMLRVRAAREHMPGIQYPGDTAWQREFEAEFPYTETEDQLAALGEIKKDMASERPMDRLLCGDVGFGKTEVAIRAAFKSCEFGKQVAVLVPTTVLAEQHERTFRSRFAGYPFRVESLSRFKTTKEINATLRDLRLGQIDVIIGTHRLLSKDVRFADLGLVIVDEEQRFGVEHKESLLRLRMTVDVLTLSATPIPRTLHMAMLGLRDISSLTTPPLDRRAIVTEVIPYNGHRIRHAIERELAREGQIFFVHNRVHNIQTMADEVQKLAPGAKIVVGHGQMPPRELEAVMLTFMRRQADILVATTIIESGIDIPTANTMIINDADKFGLADLHQLRGRVGRYKHRAYCYMLLPPDRTVKEVAQKRLKAIEQYSMLGAGFKIAMRDLEIRGAGNLLGAEQSGHIAAVGYEMYCRLLEHAVKELTLTPEEQPVSQTVVDIGVTGVIPKAYIPSDQRRIEAYRRISGARTADDLERVRENLTSAYGEPPKIVERLMDLARLRAAVAGLGARTVTIRGSDVVFLCPDPHPVVAALDGANGTVRTIEADLAQTNARSISGERLCEVYYRPPPNYMEPATLMRVLTKRLAG
ncbi:MAG: transcription-repair coupling factor [Phycisphaeraceae bacterium]|nr:MAG: transcription-repair coupling factor [Phycisphaeraceae bacterium]